MGSPSSARPRPSLRTRARTWWPRRASSAVRCRPTNPLAPVTAISTRGRGGGGWLVGAGHAAVVEEHQRPGPRYHARQRFEHRGIEYGPGEIGDPADGVFGGHLVLVRARRRECAVDLASSDDPRGARVGFAAHP